VAETLVMTIDDCGDGILPDERDAIFGRFHRGRAANLPDSPRGTGLGLALVDEQVRLHGGSIVVADSPCGGARFEIRIPAVTA
jgi:signal transduction histidine kinase